MNRVRTRAKVRARARVRLYYYSTTTLLLLYYPLVDLLDAGLVDLVEREARWVDTILGEQLLYERVAAQVPHEGATRLDSDAALGAILPPHAQPLLDASLAEAVHARRGDAAVEVAQANLVRGRVWARVWVLG